VSESPTIETRIDQPFAAIPVSVRMEELGTVVPPLTGRVFEWLAARGIAPAGPPFWRYVVVDMETKLDLETGVAVSSPVEGERRHPACGPLRHGGAHGSSGHLDHRDP
jgi:hypothetical protein